MSDQQETSSPDEKESRDKAARYNRRLTMGAIVFVAIVFGLVLVVPGDSGPNEGDAERACQESVEARLKAPSTADFGATATSEDGGKWTVRGEVDAENSFGAAIGNTYVCTLEPTDDEGDGLTLVDIEISE